MQVWKVLIFLTNNRIYRFQLENVTHFVAPLLFIGIGGGSLLEAVPS